eukprot:6426868-Amphidinium_carterae.1
MPSTTITTTNTSWGDCKAIATFNCNKITWSYLGQYLELPESEFSFSILVLQEVFDDSETDLVDGWYEICGHRLLTTHTHDNIILAMVLHRDFVPAEVQMARTSRFAVSTNCWLNGRWVNVVGCYVPQAGLDRGNPELFQEALNDIDEHLGDAADV